MRGPTNGKLGMQVLTAELGTPPYYWSSDRSCIVSPVLTLSPWDHSHRLWKMYLPFMLMYTACACIMQRKSEIFLYRPDGIHVFFKLGKCRGVCLVFKQVYGMNLIWQSHHLRSCSKQKQRIDRDIPLSNSSWERGCWWKGQSSNPAGIASSPVSARTSRIRIWGQEQQFPIF